MDQVSLVGVQPRNSLVKVGRKEIHICGSRDMRGLELARGANVQHDHLPLGDQFLCFLGINVLHCGFSGLGCVGCLGAGETTPERDDEGPENLFTILHR